MAGWTPGTFSFGFGATGSYYCPADHRLCVPRSHENASRSRQSQPFAVSSRQSRRPRVNKKKRARGTATPPQSPPVRSHARIWAVAAAASAMGGASCFGEALGATESPRLPCVCTRAAPARWSRRGGEVEPQGHRCRWSLYDPVNALAMLGAEGKLLPPAMLCRTEREPGLACFPLATT